MNQRNNETTHTNPPTQGEAFLQDVGHLALGAVAVVCLLIAAPTTPTFFSDLGQRSFICLLLHLYVAWVGA